MKPYRTFWAYCWSGFPLAIVLAIFIALATLSAVDNFPPAAIFFGLVGLIALIMGYLDYRKNG